MHAELYINTHMYTATHTHTPWLDDKQTKVLEYLVKG